MGRRHGGALVLAHTSVFTPEGAQGAHETARHALEGAWDDLFWKGGFEHCIIGTCETLYLVFSGDAGLGLFLKYFTAVVVGNVAGGVLLVAALNYAQTQDEETPERVEEEKRAP